MKPEVHGFQCHTLPQKWVRAIHTLIDHPRKEENVMFFTSRAAAESNSGVGSWEEEEEADVCSF